jgi:hypothetical protein
MIQKKQKYFSFALDVMPLRQEMWGEKSSELCTIGLKSITKQR